uniref:Proline dehydrogenase n=2 Tax=Ciona savignyi TaxID=51511 RepID=H2ZL45_CIOSA
MTATFYGQFCPGKTYDEINEATYAMQEAGIIPLLAVPTEEDSKNDVDGDVDSWYKENTRSFIECIDIISRVGVEGCPKVTHIKLTALVDQALCEKLGSIILENNGDDKEILGLLSTFDTKPVQLDMLSKEENLHLNESLARFEEICKHGSKRGVHLYVDAEYISINPALYLLSKAMMLRHNKTKPVLQVTIQAYLKSAKNETEKILKFCRDADIVFGAKIVRGAYLESEKSRAETQGYENPICDSLEATHDNYNEIVESLLRRISRNRNGKIHVMVASHNEDSVTHVVKRLHDFGIDPMREAVIFAQLYGLSDHLTNWLGANNYPVYKSTPFGTVEETMPYLYRRAQENNSLTKGDKRDRTLINMELSKRLRQLILGNEDQENMQ